MFNILSAVGFTGTFLALGLSIINISLYFIHKFKIPYIESYQKKIKDNNFIFSMMKINIYLINLCLFIAIACLYIAILTNQFNISYVFSVSSINLETKYKWAALYSSQEGSLLLWAFILSTFIHIFVRTSLNKFHELQLSIVSIFSIIIMLTLIPLVLFTSPFVLSAINQIDGKGLNPLLIDPTMLIHPPILLSGLVSTAIPFSVAIATGIATKKGIAVTWSVVIRKWILVSIFLLTLGNILGAWWAYTVLGWGGFWGWDPVENSAILALLPMIGLLHATYLHQKKGGFEYINLLLGTLGFILAIFTTFNVRSGAIDSVHSFAESDIGLYYLIFLSVLVILSIYSINKNDFHGSIKITSLLSKESAIIINIFITTMIMLAILSTLILPITFEMLKDQKIILSPDFYNQTIGALILILLTALSISSSLPKKFTSNKKSILEVTPILLLLSIFLLIAIIINIDQILIFLAFASCIGICYGSIISITRIKFKKNYNKNNLHIQLFIRSLSSHITHIGLALFAIGAISATTFQSHNQFTIAPGESYNIGQYSFKYNALRSSNPNKNGIETEVIADISLFKNNKLITSLFPGKNFFTSFPAQPVAIVDIDRSIIQDTYIFLQKWDNNLNTQFHIYINPFINLLWLGGLLYLLGTGMALFEESVVKNE